MVAAVNTSGLRSSLGSLVGAAAVLATLGCGTGTPAEAPHDLITWYAQASGTQSRLVLVGPGPDGKGLYAENDGTPEALLLSSDGAAWTAMNPSTGNNCYICRSPTTITIQGVVWMATNSGQVQHYDSAGQKWVLDKTGLAGDVFAVWGNDLSHVWAVGDGGGIAHWDGKAWAVVGSPTHAALRSIYGTTANNLYAVGDAGTILHFDGSAWTVHKSGTDRTLRDVWGSTALGVFAVGDLGEILHRATF